MTQRSWVALAVGVGLLDALSTWLALRAGFAEGNPIQAAWFASMGHAWATVLTVPLDGFRGYLAGTPRQEWTWTVFRWAGRTTVLVHVGIVARNLWLLA